MRSAMHAANQLPGRGPTDVDDAPDENMLKLIIDNLKYNIPSFRISII